MARPIVLRPDRRVAPFVHHRMVRFGDTDAARIVYTVRFFDFAMDALDAWFAEVLEHDWYTLNTECGVSCPFVSSGLDFKAPMRPGEEAAIAIRVARLGRSSLQFRITGSRPDGVVSFDGLWTLVFVDPDSSRSMPIPPMLYSRIQEYQRVCEDADRTGQG